MSIGDQSIYSASENGFCRKVLLKFIPVNSKLADYED